MKKATDMELINKYNNYIKGELSEEEMDEFTKNIVKDHFEEENLKDKWNSILDKDEELQALKNVDPKTLQPDEQPTAEQRTPTVKRLRILLSIAASLLLLVGLVFFLSRSTTANYNQLADNALKNPYAVSSSRSGNVEGQETRLSANDFYRQKDYASAIPLYEKLINDNNGKNSDLFYLGLSELYLGQAQKAIAHLEEVSTAQSDQLKTEASWYLALANIKANQLKEAEIHLQQLKDKGGWKSREAAELLEAMKKS